MFLLETRANQKGGAISEEIKIQNCPIWLRLLILHLQIIAQKHTGGAIAANLVDPVIFNSIFWHDTAYFGLGGEIYLSGLK